MSNELVGLESLPNCYITRITLDDNSTKSFTCSVDLEVLDAVESNRTIWSYSPLFSDFLRVALIETQNINLADQLTQGFISPLPSKLTKSVFFDDTTKIHNISLKEFRRSDNTYMKKVRFNVPNDTQNLSVFAFCYIDTKALSSHLKLDMTGKLSNYYGSMSSERVLVSANTIKSAVVFYKPDNTIWSGPVHQHEGVFMEGSQHTSEPHDTLRKATVQNLKLIDRRGDNYLERERTAIASNPVISNLHISINNNEDVNGLFFVNMKQLLLTKTKLGTKIANLSFRMFNDFLSQIQISQLIVKRFEANVKLTKTKLGTFRNSTINKKKSDMIAVSIDNAPYNLKAQENLKERFLFSNRNVRAFEFTDDSKTKRTKGNFKYSVEIIIKDKSQEYINNIIDKLRNSLTQLREIHYFLSKRSSYDYSLAKLKSDITVPSALEGIVQNYYDTRQYFKDFDDTEKRSLINQKIKSFSVGSYTPITSERFINDFEKLISLMSRRFGSSYKYNSKTPKTTKTTFIPARIFISKTFENDINFFDFNRSYDYIAPITTKGFPVLTPNDMLNRGNKEIDRFYYNGDVLVSDQLKTLPTEVQHAFQDIGTTKVSYFAPLQVQYKDQNASLENVDSLNFGKINIIVKEAQGISAAVLRSNSQTQLDRSAKGSVNTHDSSGDLTSAESSISTEVKDKPVSIEDSQPQELIESFYYFGENSEFVNVDDNYQPPATEDTTVMDDFVNMAYSTPTVAGVGAYDFSSGNNVTSNALNSNNFSIKNFTIKPAQIKALINSRSNSVKNNILQSPVDPLKNVLSFNAYQIVFKTLQKVEKITGFTTDANGIEIVTEPVFEMLKISDIQEDSTLICRMRYYEEGAMDIKPPINLRFPVRNEMFIISNRDLSQAQFDEIPPLLISSLSSIVAPIVKYSTTNIVIQPLNKTPVKLSSTQRRPNPTNQRVGSRRLRRGQIVSSSKTQRTRRGSGAPTQRSQRQQRPTTPSRTPSRAPRTSGGGSSSGGGY